MSVIGHSSGRLLGYVQVQVASRVYVLPVEARSLMLEDGSVLEAGFFEDAPGHFGIRVDSAAPDTVVRETIEHASEDAARHLSRKLLN
jgi:hypothetical protein